MNNVHFNKQDDEVSKLIDQLYEELMMLRFEYMTLRKKKKDNIEEMESKIIELNDDFESIVKSHTLYLRFKKVTGQSKPNHSEEMLKKIKEIENNVGKIVSTVPRQ